MELAPITEKFVQGIYDYIIKMDVTLDEDPLRFGPKRLNKKIAQTRAFLSKVERVFTRIAADLASYRRLHRRKRTELDLKKKNLYAHDPETRAGRSAADRDAIASMKLKELVEDVEEYDLGMQELDTIMTVVKSKKADLRDIQNRLRDQLKVCMEEIHLGSQWGSTDDPDTGIGNALQADDSFLDDVYKLLEETDEDSYKNGEIIPDEDFQVDVEEETKQLLDSILES